MTAFQVQGFFRLSPIICALPFVYSALISLPCKEFLLFQEALFKILMDNRIKLFPDKVKKIKDKRYPSKRKSNPNYYGY